MTTPRIFESHRLLQPQSAEGVECSTQSPSPELITAIQQLLTLFSGRNSSAQDLSAEIVSAIEKALEGDKTPRPESVDRSIRTAEDREFWATRTTEPGEVMTCLNDVNHNVRRLVQATCGQGMYLLATFDRTWVKWGYSGKLDAECNGPRIAQHRRQRWDSICACPGMTQPDERRIRTAMTRMGFEKFPGTNEVFRLSRELITAAIDLGAPLPEDPYALLISPQLRLFDF